mmetsp:Transcript_30301/g.51635  ORF Transcript_30301/g.51635 Transcript_30301/m.51635 type:complete len:137 (+) Transcript_30301:688-1098(+)
MPIAFPTLTSPSAITPASPELVIAVPMPNAHAIVTYTVQFTASRHSCCDSMLKQTIMIDVNSPTTSKDDMFWSGNSTGPIATIMSIVSISKRAGINLLRRGGFESLTSDINAKDCWLSVLREMKVGPASRSNTSPA